MNEAHFKWVCYYSGTDSMWEEGLGGHWMGGGRGCPGPGGLICTNGASNNVRMNMLNICI